MRWLVPGLFLAALLVHSGIALSQDSPGYMDADYYLLGGQNLVRGRGFSEDVLWNYLDDPAGLPHPSHAYWLPATSVLAAVGLVFNAEGGFFTARWIFVLVAALVPPLTALVAHRIYNDLTPDRRLWNAGLAGALALVPGYYLGFLTTTDSFGLYMVFGAVFTLTVLSGIPDIGKALALGALAGLMQLTRTDGFLWLLAAGLLFFQTDRRRLLPLAVGFLLVFAPWIARNLSVFGSPLVPGGSRALWWTAYDDLFAYPAEILTPARWLASGAAAIIEVRLRAAGQNLVSAVAVGGLVFLAPLILSGFRRLRASPAVWVSARTWLLVFGLMSIVFPFAGARGGYFHAAAALQPLFWAAVPEGLDAFVEWGGRVRGWRIRQAGRVFGIGAVAIAGFVTAFLGWTRFIGPSLSSDGSPVPYQLAEAVIVRSGAGPDAVVMVNNPPGYTLTNDRPSIVIPSGGLDQVLAAAERYRAGFFILGSNEGLETVYSDPEDHPGLLFLGDAAGLLVFRFEGEP